MDQIGGVYLCSQNTHYSLPSPATSPGLLDGWIPGLLDGWIPGSLDAPGSSEQGYETTNTLSYCQVLAARLYQSQQNITWDFLTHGWCTCANKTLVNYMQTSRYVAIYLVVEGILHLLSGELSLLYFPFRVLQQWPPQWWCSLCCTGD